jgi:uncharacterized protein (TIGR03435 family)
LAFEVASIKASQPGQTRATLLLPARGNVRLINVTVRQMILRAYDIGPTLAPLQLTGGPEQVLSARFDVLAKPPDGAPVGSAPAMLQTLLRERFNLRTHRETRSTRVYALRRRDPLTLGPKLHPTTKSCAAFASAFRDNAATSPPIGVDGEPLCLPVKATPGALRMRRAADVASLVRAVQGFLDRPLIDATELSGLFEWDLTFSTRPTNRLIEAPPLPVALEEQLGLELEPRDGPLEVIVIDSLSMPSLD